MVISLSDGQAFEAWVVSLFGNRFGIVWFGFGFFFLFFFSSALLGYWEDLSVWLAGVIVFFLSVYLSQVCF